VSHAGPPGNRRPSPRSLIIGSVALAAVAVLAAVVGIIVLAQPQHAPVRSHRVEAAAGPASTQAAGRAVSTPSPPERPSEPAPHRDPFGPAVRALAAGSPVEVRAAVYDVRTGQQWELGHGQPQDEASVVKLDILETLLDHYRAVDRTLPGADRPVAQQMIEYSDNDSATSLWYAAGGPAQITAFNAAAGLRNTAVSQCVTCSGFPWPGWGLTTTTPADQLTLLRQLITPGPLLTGIQRRYALGLMEHVTSDQGWGVSAGVPAGVTIALKNGWLPLNSAADDWEVNSVGWISGDGRDYLIAVLTTGSPTEQAGINLIASIAAMTWRAMGRVTP
jgi:Beta-lactamase enzyme family